MVLTRRRNFLIRLRGLVAAGRQAWTATPEFAELVSAALVQLALGLVLVFAGPWLATMRHKVFGLPHGG